MARETTRIPGSAMRAWEIIKDALFNERGEVGDDSGDQDAKEWDIEGADGKPSDPSENPEGEPEGKPEGDTKPPAEAKKPEGDPKEDPEGEPEGDEGDKPPFNEHPRWIEVQNKLKDAEGQLANVTKEKDFYQTQYNELVGKEEEEEPAKGPVEVPEEVLEPEKWETQTQMAQYFDHRAGVATKEALESQVFPVFERINEVITALQDAVVKAGHNDYDEVIASTWEEVFTVSPEGKILGVKNQGLLDYFQKQPFPQLAAYEYGLTKKAPKKIKEAKQKGAKEVLDSLEKKPKGPTSPKVGADRDKKAELDWDTPKGDVEVILDNDGLL